MSRKEKELLLGYVLHRVKEYTTKGLVEIFLKNPGRTVFEDEWDSLIILDACRVDAFREILNKRNIPGRFSTRTSLGCWTGEFLLRNFGNERHDDIVYVTANPYVDRYLKGRFHRIISVWKNHWDTTFNTVLPGAVYRETLKALKRYPEKRLIIHFMQPHHPYITLNEQKDKDMELIRNRITRRRYPLEPLNEIYLARIYAEFSLRRLIQAYKDNLEFVFPYVEMLLTKLPGKSVVTSDHGELFGERVLRALPFKIYGHGIGRNQNLVQVPWLEVYPEDKAMIDRKKVKKDVFKKEKYTILRKKELKRRLISKSISRILDKKAH